MLILPHPYHHLSWPTPIQVFWVTLASSLICGERLTMRFALSAMGAVGGISCMTLPGLMSNTLDPVGTALGLSSAVCYAAYLLLMRRSQQHESRLHVVPNLAVSTSASTITLMALASFNGDAISFPDGESFAGVVALALFVQVGG